MLAGELIFRLRYNLWLYFMVFFRLEVLLRLSQSVREAQIPFCCVTGCKSYEHKESKPSLSLMSNCKDNG